MPQTILESVTRRAHSLSALTGPARNEPANGAFILDVTEGLRACVLLRDDLVGALELQWKEACENEVEDYDLAGKSFLAALDVALRSFGAVRERAEAVKAAQQEISPQFGEAMEAFESAVAEVERLKGEFAHRWPWVDQDKFDRSVAAERQGARRYSVKEVHDELRRRFR